VQWTSIDIRNGFARILEGILDDFPKRILTGILVRFLEQDIGKILALDFARDIGTIYRSATGQFSFSGFNFKTIVFITVPKAFHHI
jgi:hypothetical protein